ncbi:predicted protein [Chaetoceros tenuissimus]|uniref:Uncharacterized protein n=1 Tax=Chaetoceros tenuissimus TaxID=426638 RepID=A0AAD3D2Y5_9STRA|nr:predicted protein [Chaetoceros tenuissimus]
MKLALLKAFLAIQVCQVVQATDDHADNLTSRVSKTLTKQFKTISSIMEKHPVNIKSIHALQKKKKNFKSLHRGLEQDFEVSDCLMDLYNIFEISEFYELDVYLNGFTILPDFSAYTWIGSVPDLSALSDACADLGGSISFLDVNVEGDQCEELPLVYGPFCIPNSCTIEEALAVLNQGPPDDDYFGDDDNIGDVDGDDVRRLDEDHGTDDSEGDDHTDHDDFYDDCSYEYVLSEGPPEITDSCLTYVYNIVAANPNLFLVRYLYGFFTEFDNLEYYWR